MKPIYAEVTYYKNHLVVEYKLEESNDIVTSPFDSQSMGYVISDIGYVGISKEAYASLKDIPRSGDDMSEIDVFKLADGNYAFATLGSKYVILDLDNAEGSSSFSVPSLNNFQLIGNNVPEGAKNAIDSPIDDDDDFDDDYE